MKITLDPDKKYDVLPKTTTFDEIRPGDRFLNGGRTWVVLKAQRNHTGKMVEVEMTCISDHPDETHNYRPIGMRIEWRSRLTSPVHRRVYRPDTWNSDEEPFYTEYVIFEEGYAEKRDWWAEYQAKYDARRAALVARIS